MDVLAENCVLHNNARMQVRREKTVLTKRVKQPNRVREIRNRKDLSQNALAERLGWHQQKLSRIEAGETKLIFEDAIVIALALEVSPIDLFADMPMTVPLRFVACSRYFEHGPERPELPEPQQRIAAPPKLEKPEECVAVEVLDNSADRLYLKGTYLIMRERPFAGKLKPGAAVVVGRYETARKGRFLAEVLVGHLAPNTMGDLMVALRSSNRELPPMVLLRGQEERAMSFGDRPEIYVPEQIDVTPRPGDAAEILGKIERVIAPV